MEVALEAIKGKQSHQEIADKYGVSPENVSDWKRDVVDPMAFDIFFGFAETKEYQSLCEFGNELYKVVLYEEAKAVEDAPSKSILNLARSAYYSGVVPAIKLEQNLFISQKFQNEYAYTLALRSYFEIVGRVRFGAAAWASFAKKTKTIDELLPITQKLLSTYEPPKGADDKEKNPMNGYNIMKFIDKLDKEMKGARTLYEKLSTYIHGDTGFHEFIGHMSYYQHKYLGRSPVIEANEHLAGSLFEILEKDLSTIMDAAKVFRARYDENPESFLVEV